MSSNLRIGDAGSKGKGVFAAGVIEPGETVYEYVDGEQWIWDIPQEQWQYTFQVDYDRYILPRRDTPGWYLNHSCNPNCVIMGRTRILALRRIEAGTEVTIDYSTNVGWDGFVMECKCGSADCRGVIRSYRYLSGELKDRYGACVSRFLLEEKSSSGRQQ